ncbi:hypothetical protein CN514_09980 [Bacillus sp. AFS001701]|nr:hypothetical protein CN514_09980 [Bacillus sp. AFS001701]
MEKYTCPCCGYKTLSEEENGSYEICLMCYWEDDYVMNENPDYWGGANHVCLRQAQRNFIRFGVSEKKYLDKVVKGGYKKDPSWKPVWENEVKLNEKKIVEILIEGNILKNGFTESLHINEFLDEFTDFLESKGWGFGGDIKEVSTEIDKD